ncbi:MAG: CHASE2 domain-containing protein [Cyanobacteria bacterium P01_F01_bin.150]
MRSLLSWLYVLMLRTRWRWMPGGLAFLIILGCLKVGAFQSSEYLAFNTLIQLRDSQPWHDDIVVIEIDEPTLKAVGEFPLSRRYYAQVLDFLRHAQSGVVVLGVVFSEPSPDDDRLAQAMLYHGQVVLAQAWSQNGRPTLPTKVLIDSAIHSGHVLNYPDSDGITRSIRPYIQGVPALGIAAIQAYSLTTDVVPLPEGKHLFWINWPDSNKELERYSFLDVLQRNVEGDRFENKLVVIGSSIAGVDPIATPFNQDPPATGIDLQAAVISNLLYGNHLRVLFPPCKMLLLLICGPLLSLYLSRCSIWGRWLSGATLAIGWWSLSFLLLKGLNVWVPLVWPVTLIVLNVSFTEISSRLKFSAILQEEVERLWQTYRRDVLVQAAGTIAPPVSKEPGFRDGVLLGDAKTWLPQNSTTPHLIKWIEEKWMTSRPKSFAEGTRVESTAIYRTHQLTELVEMFGRSQALHGAIARSLSIGLVAADWNGQVWFCNPAATDLLGISIGHLLANTLIPHWLNQGTWEQYLRHLQQGQTIRWEIPRCSHWFEISLEPLSQASDVLSSPSVHQRKKQFPATHTFAGLLDSAHQKSPNYPKHEQLAGELIGLLLIVENITTYKQVEEEMSKALAQEKEFNELKSRFVSMVSHELRTPLTIIQTSLEMLERRYRKIASHSPPSVEPSDSNIKSYPGHASQQLVKSTHIEFNNGQQKYFQRINNAVFAMTQLLEDVLLLGRVEAKKLEFNPQYLDCAQLCYMIVEEMQVQPLGYPRIVFKAQGDIRRHYVDADLLKMILGNLLSNAIKYSADHTFIYVDVDCRSDSIVLQVEDRGIGIPSDTQQQLFKEFHRATNVGSVPGTGLGLSIVKQCVDLHQGKIVVESAVNVGSTFIIHLPSHPHAQ